jgi:alpha-glucosidase
LPIERIVAYYGTSGEGAHLPFNFQLIGLPWNARAIGAAVENYEALLPAFGWPNWVLGNHDKTRIATRVGVAQARVAAMLLLTLRGTPTMYYGDEIGMRDVPIAPDKVQDPFEKNIPGRGLGRDPERTPMQWDNSAQAGFSSGTSPWLPIAEDFTTVNVAAEKHQPASLLTLYKRLIELRRAETALSVGAFARLPADDDLLAYVRRTDDRRILVVLNLGSKLQSFDLAPLACSCRLLLSSYLDKTPQPLAQNLSVRPDEGLIIELC